MPALSSSQIVQMIKTPPSGVTAGRASFAAQRAWDVPSHAKFAADMAAMTPPSVESVTHPEDMVRGQGRATKELTPSDLVWLQRLPQDPADVPFPDAVSLAGMHAGVTASQPVGSSDRRLIESVYAPVKAYHDHRVADAAVSNARQPVPPVPSSALPALADAVAAEVPQLNDGEVMARAGDMLRQALEERNATRDQAMDRAQSQKLGVVGGDFIRTSPTHVA